MQEMASDYYYEFVAFLLCTGMRFGETAALTWNDIDYKQNVIHVMKTVTFNEDNTRTTGTPKSESGKIVSVHGKMMDNCAVNRAIRNALERLAEQDKPIKHFTAHALRDTFATRYIERGGSPQT